MKKRWILLGMLWVCWGSVPRVAAEDTNLAENFGFQSLDIIKLNWDLRDLTLADVDADGLQDILVINNHKAQIDILIQRTKKEIEDARVKAYGGDLDDINKLPSTFRFGDASRDAAVFRRDQERGPQSRRPHRR